MVGAELVVSGAAIGAVLLLGSFSGDGTGCFLRLDAFLVSLVAVVVELASLEVSTLAIGSETPFRLAARPGRLSGAAPDRLSALWRPTFPDSRDPLEPLSTLLRPTPPGFTPFDDTSITSGVVRFCPV